MIRTVLTSVLALGLLGSAADAASFQKKQTAQLRALDKITGRSTDIEIVVGEPVVFGSLKVELQVCYQTPPEEPPESAAFLKIHSTKAVAVDDMTDAVAAENVATVSDENPQLFSGWMYASSPGLSALEHPVYDIWVIRCATVVPSSAPDEAEADGAGTFDEADPVDFTPSPDPVVVEVPGPETETEDGVPVVRVTPAPAENAEEATEEDPLGDLLEALDEE